MSSLLLIGLPAVALALEPAPDVQSVPEPGVRPEWLYTGVHRPVMIEVTPPESAETMRLVLMDADGNLHVEPFAVEAGRFDLSEAVPEIWRLRRAAYLQLFADDAAVGSSLVVQPMLSRLVPVTEEALNPSGVTYTRITGWYDETRPPAAPGDAPGDRPDGELMDPRTEPAEDPWLPNRRVDDDTRLLSGLRLYTEHDVVVRTTRGDSRLALRPDHAPNAVWNFLMLCHGGFYRDIPFHRIVPMTRDGDPFVIQAGDPTETGSGGPGYWLPLERSTLPHDFGVLSMARDIDPDSAGSQFFICLSRAGTARLDGNYCAFGQAVEGAGVIQAIADTALADVATGRPADPPVIEFAVLVPSPPRGPGFGRPDPPVRPGAAEPPPAPATRPERIAR
jgi:peptidyl-prolyl cis-trans isomerase B (cyclophilin B)